MSVSQQIHSASAKVGDELHELEHAARRLARGTVAGFLGGLAAAWVMNRYQEMEERTVKLHREQLRLAYAGPESKHSGRPLAAHVAPPVTPAVAEAEIENQPTVKAAEQMSRKLFEHELSSTEKKLAGPAVHYGYGAVVGALYGGLSELIPTVGIGLGIPYAALLWLAGSEAAVPALGLAKPPTQVPAQKHATAVATHFVYGLTLDISRRILRRLL
jgi:uncharacterized membrane protein YagU involved in acid resistance